MKKLRPEEYHRAGQLISETDCGGVYARSITELTQLGEVFICGNSVLFRHYCGFALVYGDCDERFLGEIYDTFLSGKNAPARRFILFGNERVKAYFSGNSGVSIGRRFFFAYPADRTVPGFPPAEGYGVRRITPDIIGGIRGNITPSFSWDSTDAFLEKSAGYCVLSGDRPAAWAFGAAVSAGEIDIGVETCPDFRGRGLASAAAAAMVRFTLSSGRRPVWACSSENTASRALALRLGFEQCSGCFTIRRDTQSNKNQ